MSPDELYVRQVIDRLPHVAAVRSQVEMEIRSHIAERLEHGQTVGEALRQLGDPVILAESYLTAIPLMAASFWRRGAARIIDFLAFILVCGPIVWLLTRLAPSPVAIAVAVFLLVAGGFYPLVAEYWFGETLGKHLLGLRVVRESGGRISFGQAVVRQLPILLQIFWIDVLFALFTEKHQRAFEVLSKTRVVLVAEETS